MRALVVEDDARITELVSSALTSAGFLTDAVADGETAWFRGGTEDYDLVILDLGLPRLDGLTLLKRWRAEGRAFPVLVLSARGTWSERVEGIEAGADDYLPKPFMVEEMTARARALVRRASGQVQPVHRSGGLAVDLNRMTVSRDGMPVAVTPLEYRLLAYLLLNRDRTVPPHELVDHLYGTDDAREANAIEAIITRLRRKLGAEAIQTRRGFGYCFGPGA
ncbi:response regulator transcription factor [Rhodobacteraceae bacterium HSP-20]|uniref:Response regulator transcription factor n=1 Tax=Paragemmobacter amnigenus TaxID=2852097 RepID=A0ABS6J1M4_9RHOB|nr:response regulator transcription factor [Rhodobacter amnigenus]MBU9697659.1 response regulator transcription factor [Rhodobacter amnigenus]MBV4388886.1 response regulator transcription factor [Rhodobacter amnigenus]